MYTKISLRLIYWFCRPKTGIEFLRNKLKVDGYVLVDIPKKSYGYLEHTFVYDDSNEKAFKYHVIFTCSLETYSNMKSKSVIRSDLESKNVIRSGNKGGWYITMDTACYQCRLQGSIPKAYLDSKEFQVVFEPIWNILRDVCERPNNVGRSLVILCTFANSRRQQMH